MRSLQSFGTKVRQIHVAMAARRVPDLFICANVAVSLPVLIRTTKALLSLVNQTLFRERACASERGEGKEKYGLAKLARFSRPRQDLVVTNQIADPA